MHDLTSFLLGNVMVVGKCPFFEEWLEKRHGVLTFRMKHVLNGHGKFGKDGHLIQMQEAHGYHCVDRLKDIVEHTVEVTPLGQSSDVSLCMRLALAISRYRSLV